MDRGNKSKNKVLKLLLVEIIALGVVSLLNELYGVEIIWLNILLLILFIYTFVVEFIHDLIDNIIKDSSDYNKKLKR